MTHTINISLPDNLSKQIRLQVKNGGYNSVSEFIREASRNLIRVNSSFSPEAEKTILSVSKNPVKNDLKFDSQKQNVSEMFAKIKQT